jgi:hypothetical protein
MNVLFSVPALFYTVHDPKNLYYWALPPLLYSAWTKLGHWGNDLCFSLVAQYLLMRTHVTHCAEMSFEWKWSSSGRHRARTLGLWRLPITSLLCSPRIVYHTAHDYSTSWDREKKTITTFLFYTLKLATMIFQNSSRYNQCDAQVHMWRRLKWRNHKHISWTSKKHTKKLAECP